MLSVGRTPHAVYPWRKKPPVRDCMGPESVWTVLEKTRTFFLPGIEPRIFSWDAVVNKIISRYLLGIKRSSASPLSSHYLNNSIRCWLDGPGIESQWREIFRIPLGRPWDSPSLLYVVQATRDSTMPVGLPFYKKEMFVLVAVV